MSSFTLNNGQNGSPWANKNRQPTYGQGLGGIQQFGYANPLGPYSGLAQAGAGGAPGAGSGSSATTTGNSDAEAWFKNVMDGKNLPFSPEQQAAQMTQQTDMSAAAESAQNEQMMANAAAGGASATDPSMQGAKAAALARRQTDNSQARGAITSKANTANFGAQMDAAGQLNSNAMQRAGWAQQQSNNAQSQASSFLPWNQRGGGGGDDAPKKQSYFGNYQFGSTPAARPSSMGVSNAWSKPAKPAVKKPYPVASDGYYEME